MQLLSSGLTAPRPGQIWLIEHDPGSPLCEVDRDALTQANVVIYDRALDALVSHILPPGAYAEAAPAGRETGPALTARAIDLAAEGWSVVQLVEARPGLRRRLATLPGRVDPELPVLIIVKAPGADFFGCDFEPRRASLGELAEAVGALGDDNRLTLVIGPTASVPPVQLYAFTANGLAG